MKHLLLTAAVVLYSGYLLAQKPSLGKAENLWKQRKYEEAKTIIDLCETGEKTATNAKTFYLKALIYASLDTAGRPAVPNTPEVVANAFNKSDELNKTDKELYILDESGLPVTFSQHKQGYWSYYFNKAILAYEEANGTDDEEVSKASFAKSVENFEIAQILNPEDTNAFVYAGYAAQSAQLYDKSMDNFEKAIAKGANSFDVWNYYIYVSANLKQDLERALAVTKRALVVFPNHPEIQKTQINIYIKLNRMDEALNGLMKAVEAEPGNSQLHFTLGVMYDELLSKEEEGSTKKPELREKAMASYQNAVKADPSNYDAQFNIGVLLYNDARDIIQQINNLTMSKADQQKEKQLVPILNEKLKIALPQWEILNTQRPNERVTLETLELIYKRLKMYDKAQIVMDQLDKMN